jgi:hypothetical protein
MKKLLIAVSAIAVIAAAGYGGLVLAEKKIADAVIAGMNEGGTAVTVKSATYSLLSGRLELTDLVAIDKVKADRKFAASLLVAEGVNRDAGSLIARGLKGEVADTLPVSLVKKLDITGLRWSDGADSVTADRMIGSGITVAPGKLPRVASISEAFAQPTVSEALAAFGAERIETAKGVSNFQSDVIETEKMVIEGLSGGIARQFTGQNNSFVSGHQKGSGKLASFSMEEADVAAVYANRLVVKSIIWENADFIGAKGEKVAFGRVALINPKPIDFGALETAPDSVMATWSVGNVSFRDLKVTVPEEQTDVTLGLFEIDKLGDGKLGSAKLSGLKVDVKKNGGSFGLGEIAVSDVDYSALVAGNVSGLMIKKVNLSDLVVDVPNSAKVTLASATTEYTRFEQSLPAAGVSSFNGLAISEIRDPEGREAFQKLGYDGASFDMEMRFDWKSDTGAFALETFKITGKDMGVFSLAFVLGGLDYDTAASGNAFALLDTLRIESLDVRYDDNSLVGRLMKAAAAEQGGDPEMIRAMMLTMLDEQRRQVSKNPIAVDAIKGLKSFVEQPKNISLTLRPNEPVGYEDFMDEDQDPAALARLLGVKVEANK